MKSTLTLLQLSKETPRENKTTLEVTTEHEGERSQWTLNMLDQWAAPLHVSETCPPALSGSNQHWAAGVSGDLLEGHQRLFHDTRPTGPPGKGEDQ